MKKVLLLTVVLFALVSANAQFINTPSSQSQPKTQTKSSSSGDVTFCGEFNAGMMIGKTKYDDNKIDGTMIAPVFTGTFGVKLNDYLFFGAGVGFKYMTQNGSEDELDYEIYSFMMPLFAEIRAFIPVSDVFMPFVMADFGYGVRLSGEFKPNKDMKDKMDKSDTKGGLCYKFGGGLAIDNFILALGYDCQKFGVKYFSEDFTSSGFFFSVGYAF
ncbi:MAG: outer membrane beta-barrel protein [Bacteroidales bacterium]|nr:outer membrane beta-barrel protein [Bacteroidales bacterium]